jgi:hypothetical protein
MDRSHGLPQHPADVWLATTFPQLNLLRTQIATDLRHRPTVPAEVDDKAFYGDLVERALGLTLCEQPPYADLLDCLTHRRAATLLTLAGYQPRPGDTSHGYERWQRTPTPPSPLRIFTAAHRLARVHNLLHPRNHGRNDTQTIANILRRHYPDALQVDPRDLDRDWHAFSTWWTSYTSGFHYALRSYGTATAQLPLCDGLRHADLMVGGTIVEVKTGRLDHDPSLDDLVRQLITYPLLACHDRRPVTHVAVYATRYQRLIRWPEQPLLDQLAGRPVDVTTTATGLITVIHTWRHRRRAA